MKFLVRHPELGDVIVTQRQSSRCFTARWKNGQIHLSSPVGVVEERIKMVLDSLSPRLLARRPQPDRLLPGSELDLDMIRIQIKAGEQRHTRVSLISPARDPYGKYLLTLSIGGCVDVESDDYASFISKAILSSVDPVAEDLLTELGHHHAHRVGDYPAQWRIGRGLRILGTCSRDRVITLSRALLCLPRPLCDYVVCHELAHLREMNHSDRFHRILEEYLPGERAYASELRRFKWPIVR